MNAKPIVLALALAIATGAAASNPWSQAASGTAAVNTAALAAINVPDPARQLQEMAQLFRAGDVARLAEAMVPPAKWQEMHMAYELVRAKPISDEDRAAFQEKLAQFTAPDAVDQLMARIEPKLAELRPQVPGALLMGFGALHVAISSPDSELTPEQRAALAAALPGLQRWASSTDFLDAQALRHSLSMLSDAARRTGLDSLDQIRALPLEGVLDRASMVFVAAKDAIRGYGIDLDAIADSMRVEVLELQADRARVRTTVTVFDAPLSHEHELVLVDGRWYGKEAVVHFNGMDMDLAEVDVAVDAGIEMELEREG